MLDHVSITVTNIDAAEVFYDAIMSALGVPKVRRSELRLGYGERCDGDHPDRITCRSRLAANRMARRLGISVSKRKIERQLTRFGKWAWRTEGRTMVLPAFARSTMRVTMLPS
jgi:catechol 2,3-dioxygenase-like lactoylglutathione lyase family enzyme